MSNLGLERYLNAMGLKLARTAVGDRYVVEHMREHGFNVGGEQSGHIVLSDFATTGDGLIAALQVLAVIAESEQKASEATHLFEPLPQILKNVRFRAGAKPLESQEVATAIQDGEARLANKRPPADPQIRHRTPDPRDGRRRRRKARQDGRRRHRQSARKGLRRVNADSARHSPHRRRTNCRPMQPTRMRGRVLIVAGSDSGGGAGIQADIKTVTALGAYAATAITAVTVQNTLGVTGIHADPAAIVVAQIKAVLDDIGADVIKTGMLASGELIDTVFSVLKREAPTIPLIVDPVMVAKGGAALHRQATRSHAMKARLLPRATLDHAEPARSRSPDRPQDRDAASHARGDRHLCSTSAPKPCCSKAAICPAIASSTSMQAPKARRSGAIHASIRATRTAPAARLRRPSQRDWLKA